MALIAVTVTKAVVEYNRRTAVSTQAAEPADAAAAAAPVAEEDDKYAQYDVRDKD